jgi:hypothetical protein
VREAVKKGVSLEPPIGEELRAETEKPPLLEAITSKQLVKTQQSGKCLTDALVICTVWILTVAL